MGKWELSTRTYLSVKEVENVGVEEAAVRHAVLPQGSRLETPSGEGGHGRVRRPRDIPA